MVLRAIADQAETVPLSRHYTPPHGLGGGPSGRTPPATQWESKHWTTRSLMAGFAHLERVLLYYDLADHSLHLMHDTSIFVDPRNREGMSKILAGPQKA
jgi:hypothetical protein